MCGDKDMTESSLNVLSRVHDRTVKALKKRRRFLLLVVYIPSVLLVVLLIVAGALPIIKFQWRAYLLRQMLCQKDEMLIVHGKFVDVSPATVLEYGMQKNSGWIVFSNPDGLGKAYFIWNEKGIGGNWKRLKMEIYSKNELVPLANIIFIPRNEDSTIYSAMVEQCVSLVEADCNASFQKHRRME